MLVIVIGLSSNNSTAGIFLPKRRDDETTAPRGKIVSKITKEVFRDTFDEDVDPTCATKTSARVKTNDCWLTGLENFARAQRHFLFKTSRTKGTNRVAILPNEHASSRSPITRTFRANQGGECQRSCRPFFKLVDDVVNIFHGQNNQLREYSNEDRQCSIR